MNKSELVSRLTQRLGGDRAVAVTAVNGVLDEIQNSVANGERVSLTGFGTFDRRERAARTGRNPRTGATIQVAASVAPVFRAGTGFRALLGQNGSSPSTAQVETDAAPKAKKKDGKKKARKADLKATTADSGRSGKKGGKKGAKKGS